MDSRKTKKIILLVISLITYVNIGNVIEKETTSTNRDVLYQGDHVEITLENGIVTGKGLWMVRVGTDENKIFFPSWITFSLWPVVLLISIISWIGWFLFFGGILEGPYTIPIVIFFILSTYSYFKLK